MNKRLIEKGIQPLEHGGRIAATSTETGSMRDPLHQRDGHPVRDPGFLTEKFHRLDAEIAGIGRDLGIIAGQ